MDSQYEKLIGILGKDKVKVNEPMALYTTFKIGGPADLFVEVENEDELIKVLKTAKDLKIPYFVFGGGSNILIGDKGIKGLTIKLLINYYQLTDSNFHLKIIVGAGMPVTQLLDKCVEDSLTGLEFMAGIPGTVGGAVRGNSGAWQKNFGDQIVRVKILKPDGEMKYIDRDDCRFSYRESCFKKSNDIILEAEIALEKGDQEEIKEKIKGFLEKRLCQPKEPSAGCIFVNPKPLSAGELIDQCGLKGKSIGGAKISEKHANFIVNTGGAKTEDVISLIDLAKKSVKEKFNIILREEIVRIGEF